MLVVIFLLLFFIFSKPVWAQVVIAEVMPQPLSGQSDWVKFFNTATISASLSGWVVEDVLSSPSVIYSFAAGEQIEGEGFFTINISNKLNNSGDGVVLKNSLGEVVDAMSYQGSTQGVSWLREVFSSPQPSASPTTSPVPALSPVPTPSSTPSPTPQTFSHDWQLKVTEIMSCPIAPTREWIRIENLLDQQIILEDFVIRDQNNNRLVFSLVLGAKESSVLELERNIFNNTGDKLYLLAPDAWQFDFVQIPACDIKGESFVWHNGKWVQLSFWRNTKSTPSPSPSVSPSPDSLLVKTQVEDNSQLKGKVPEVKSNYKKNYFKNIDLQNESFTKIDSIVRNIPQLDSFAPAKWPTIFVILSGTLLMLGATLLIYAKISQKPPTFG